MSTNDPYKIKNEDLTRGFVGEFYRTPYSSSLETFGAFLYNLVEVEESLKRIDTLLLEYKFSKDHLEKVAKFMDEELRDNLNDHGNLTDLVICIKENDYILIQYRFRVFSQELEGVSRERVSISEEDYDKMIEKKGFDGYYKYYWSKINLKLKVETVKRRYEKNQKYPGVWVTDMGYEMQEEEFVSVVFHKTYKIFDLTKKSEYFDALVRTMCLSSSDCFSDAN